MKIIDKIYETKDYSMLINTNINRGLIERHVIKLMSLIKIEGQHVPILTVKKGNKYHILDGGHRFEACKRLKIPVKFMVDNNAIDDIKTMATLNTQEKFKDSDYVKGYVAEKNSNYKIYEKFCTDFPDFPKGACALLLAFDGGGNSIGEKFRQGEFRVGSLDKANQCANELIELKPYLPEYNRVKFVQAYLQKRIQNEFDPKVFLHSIKKRKYKDFFIRMNNVTTFANAIIEVYNDGLKLQPRIK